MDIKTLGVIGAGQMGNGIAQVAAMSGMDVIMSDISAEFVQKGLTTITRNPVAECRQRQTFGSRKRIHPGQDFYQYGPERHGRG